MEALNLTEPHYIRCVKPNSQLKPGIFEHMNVMHQLRSGGVLEAVRIKCAGFPTHRTFQEFLTRLGILAPETIHGNFEEMESCKKILEKVGLTGYQIGKTKIFLRAGHMAELDARRAYMLSSSATIIQKQTKSYFSRKTYLTLRKSSIFVQSICRGELARRQYYHLKRKAAAIKIQTNSRGRFARKCYFELRISAIVLQTGFRAMAARHACDKLRYRKQTRASTIIQSYWRRHKALIDYQNLKKASVISRSVNHSSDEHEQKIAEISPENESPSVEKSSNLLHEESSSSFQDNESIEAIRIFSNPLRDTESNEASMDISSPLRDTESNEAIRDLSSPPRDTGSNEAIRDLSSPLRDTESNEATSDLSSSLRDTEKIEALSAEIKNLKVMLKEEKQKTDEYERKYVEAQGSSEELRKKLSETEKRVYQLQDSLNRMISSMSSQVAELKTILSTSSRLSSTFRPIARVDVASSNSDSSSTDSDFTFPAPVSNPEPVSSADSNAFQLVVQDITAGEESGSESEKEGSFDDFF
ncbi:hypothetical protein KIW84_061538 [Lathyrus oleraceus]|nr:hypothetical protein KIW84_061538 [Pisum sativum]